MELLYAIKNIRTESELNELKLALSHFFADKAQKELDELWDSGVLDQKKLDELREQHLRTPYRFLQKARTIRYGKIFCKGS